MPPDLPSVGDIVALKSGGPLMTVEKCEYRGDDKKYVVTCVWFDKNDELRRNEFAPDAIVGAGSSVRTLNESKP